MSTQHKDIVDAQLHEAKGSAAASVGQILTATGTGTSTFQTPPFTKCAMGFWDYNDTATTGTPIPLTTAGTQYQLTNNGLGANTLTTYRLPAVTNIWNTATNYFQFVGLKLGDTVDVRLDIDVTTASTNNNIEIAFELGIGGASYQLILDSRYLKSSGAHPITVIGSVYMGNTTTLNNPARLLIKNDTAGSTVKVTGWFVRAITNG